MKFRLPILSLLIFASSFMTPSQVPPNAFIVDESGPVACDDMLARVDNFLIHLEREPGSSGLVVIESSPLSRRNAVFHAALIESAVKNSSKLHMERIKFVRASSSVGIRVQYWLIPRGAVTPTIANVDISYALPPGIKPFMFSWEYGGDDGICPIINSTMLLAKFMAGNPKARVNIVFRGLNRKDAYARLNVLTKRYGISKARTRIFFAAKESINDPIVEYWFLP
jgi:hypothetical protein